MYTHTHLHTHTHTHTHIHTHTCTKSAEAIDKRRQDGMCEHLVAICFRYLVAICMCVYIYLYIYIYICIYIFVSICIHICVRICTDIYTHMYIHVHIYPVCGGGTQASESREAWASRCAEGTKIRAASSLSALMTILKSELAAEFTLQNSERADFWVFSSASSRVLPLGSDNNSQKSARC